MNENRFICVDIGSTWTKAAVFDKVRDSFNLKARAEAATTVSHLPDGVQSVISRLQAICGCSSADPAFGRFFFSSSAKGGLNVAVVGLVPEMSLQIARIAAFSAGARVSAAYPYRLTRSCVTALERARPDILLLCGGTDGGNERYVTENARAIADSGFSGTIVYAGNNQAVDSIRELLDGRDLRITENLMPDFGRLNIEPVRETIRQVYLERIVTGKGLDELVRIFKTNPLPTPLAVFNLVEAVGKHVDGWDRFALIDMGGATTDFYSFCEAFNPDSGAVLKGIMEPALKRTVEGDLGMRVSAASVMETAHDFIQENLADCGQNHAAMKAYVDRLSADTSYLPADLAEQQFDRLLAAACIYHAIRRHAGTVEKIYTTGGPIFAQTGKDLRGINRIVGSGGFLAAMARTGDFFEIGATESIKSEKKALLPENFEYYADTEYVLPLIASLAAEFPSHSASSAVHYLAGMHHKDKETVKEFSHREFVHT